MKLKRSPNARVTLSNIYLPTFFNLYKTKHPCINTVIYSNLTTIQKMAQQEEARITYFSKTVTSFTNGHESSCKELASWFCNLDYFYANKELGSITSISELFLLWNLIQLVWSSLIIAAFFEFQKKYAEPKKNNSDGHFNFGRSSIWLPIRFILNIFEDLAIITVIQFSKWFYILAQCMFNNLVLQAK